ncbi:1705_t:CDS:2 [Acaulospora morrowiae]|uniref:1705_t:CDS:1 n=1 Tax=Acaulospora morrowiae TaxID=94023 RepID=A0A9N8W8P0_9GLOM|nr:1705_t:CDS:2 [Acaulospora morrowiae]
MENTAEVSREGTGEGLVRPDKSGASNDESKDTFDELKYESKQVEEKEKYYMGEQSEEEETIDKEIPSPAVYLTILKEIPTLEDNEEYMDKKLREKQRNSITGGKSEKQDEEFNSPGPPNEDLPYQYDADGAIKHDPLGLWEGSVNSDSSPGEQQATGRDNTTAAKVKNSTQPEASN